MNEVLNDESTSASSILVTPFLEQVSFRKASSHSWEILLKFCSICSVCFHFTPYYVDITFKIFHNANSNTEKTNRAKMSKRESGKKSTFFYFDKNIKKLKKLEKCIVLTFLQ